MNINNHKFPTEKQMNKNMRTLSGRLFFWKIRNAYAWKNTLEIYG